METHHIDTTVRVNADPNLWPEDRRGIIYRVHGEVERAEKEDRFGDIGGWDQGSLQADPIGAWCDKKEVRWTEAQIAALDSVPMSWQLYDCQVSAAINSVLADLVEKEREAIIEAEARRKGVGL